MKLNQKKEIFLRYSILAAISVVFLLFCSAATSPLTDYYGADSAFFMLVGRGMTEGKLPFRDFFDSKGPYLFLIEYLGQLICKGRTGIFIIQCVNLFISLCLVDKIYRMSGRTGARPLLGEMLCLIPVLFVAGFTFQWGNLTEEYSLPPLLLALYFALGYLERGEAKHPAGIGFYYGFAFGILALIRITNAALIGGIILTVSVHLLLGKQFRNLLLNGVAFLLGCVAAFAPACLYFACHGLLGEMLRQVFLYGVQYSSQYGLGQKFIMLLTDNWACVLLMLFPVVLPALIRVKKWQYWLLSVSAFLLLLLAASMGNGYLHYFTLGIPNLVMSMALLLQYFRTEGALSPGMKKGIIALIAVLLALQMPSVMEFTAVSAGKALGLGNDAEEYAQIQEIKACIPQEDYDSVFVYAMENCSGWYAQAQLYPSHRYCDWHARLIALNPQVENELTEWIAGKNPKWVVISTNYFNYSNEVAAALVENYHIAARNAQFVLYTVNES